MDPQQVQELRAHGVSLSSNNVAMRYTDDSQAPYPSLDAAVGGLPNVDVDVPISAVFIVMYMCCAAATMTIFRLNLSRGHKFLPSALLFGFSMARITTFSLRIAWAVHNDNVRLAIAAQIFVNAGILIVYIINFLCAQRILRALQPQFGWNPILRVAFKMAYALIGISLIMVITCIVLTSYTLNSGARSDAEWIERGVILYLFIFAAFPLVLIAVATLLPRPANPETFGHGSMLHKVIIVLAATSLCTIVAGFRVGTIWSAPRPRTDPAWYDSKAAFYCFDPMLEVLALVWYISLRFDRHFHIPDGSGKRRSYLPFVDQEKADGHIETRDSELDDSAA